MRILEASMSGTIGTRHMGPVSNDILQLSNRFAALGHEVTVCDLPSEDPRELLHSDVQLVEVEGLSETQIDNLARSRPVSRVEFILRRWRNYHRIVRSIHHLNERLQADIVHFHWPAPLFIAQTLYRLPTVYTSHTPVWSLQTRAPRSVLARFNSWVERQAIRRSRLTVALGEYLALAVPESDIATIPNGIAVDEWNVLDRATARRALGIDEGAFVVLFVGRIAPIKGVDTLIDALKSIAPSHPDLQTFIIGSLSGAFDTRDDHLSPYAQHLLDAARGLPVKLLGFISNRTPEFRQYLAAADVSVVPSRHEPQGNVVLESLAMGTPVIGSDTGGIPDMVSADVGYLFPPGDAAALARCIEYAYLHPDELIAKRPEARQRILDHYSWDGIAARYLAEFQKRVDSRPDSSPQVATNQPAGDPAESL